MPLLAEVAVGSATLVGEVIRVEAAIEAVMPLQMTEVVVAIATEVEGGSLWLHTPNHHRHSLSTCPSKNHCPMTNRRGRSEVMTFPLLKIGRIDPVTLIPCPKTPGSALMCDVEAQQGTADLLVAPLRCCLMTPSSCRGRNRCPTLVIEVRRVVPAPVVS